MAAKYCICSVCHEKFDRNSVQAVISGARRYAHQSCLPTGEPVPMEVKPVKVLSKEEQNLKDLKDYINTLYGDKANWPLITKQIKTFHDIKHYTYESILSTLKFFYEVQHNTVDKSNGGIGIVEFTYESAKQYYYKIWLAQQANQNKTFVEKVKEYVFKPSKSRGIKNKLLDWSNKDEE